MFRSAPRLASIAPAFLLVLFTAPWAAHADCSDYPANLLATENCDADDDASGWDSNGAVITHESSDGVPPGAVQVEGFDTGKGYSATVLLCAPGADQTTYSFGAAVRQVSGDPGCVVGFIRFNNADCSGGALSGSTGLASYPGDLSEWRFASGTQTLDVDVRLSAAIRIVCSSGSPFTVLVDNAYLIEGTESVPFFFDGFEDGDLEHWSAAVP